MTIWSRVLKHRRRTARTTHRCGGIALLVTLAPAGAAAQTSDIEADGESTHVLRGDAGRLQSSWPYRHDSQDSRMRGYVLDVIGPRAIVRTLLTAGIDQLRDKPEEWNGTLDGYGRRVASRTGRYTVRYTVWHGLAAALDRPVEYQLCRCSSRGERVRHAFLGTVTESTADGGRTLAVPRIVGIYAGEFAQLAWIPGEFDARDALASGTRALVASAIGNLVWEFLGDRK